MNVTLHLVQKREQSILYNILLQQLKPKGNLSDFPSTYFHTVMSEKSNVPTESCPSALRCQVAWLIVYKITNQLTLTRT